ncbi:MAG TPA: DUF5723 family protein [Candidatus Kapabacteria bacterium]|nr:DUF5723 family protein [Candidatus Kapabacteria bacterium]
MRFAFLLLLVTIPASIFAQEGYEHFSPIAHGAGKTYVTTSQGLSAIGLNPSRITPEAGTSLVVSVFPVSGFGFDKGPSWSGDSLASVFNLNGGNISNPDRKRISNLLLNEKMSGRIDGEILAIDYVVPQLGTLAFSWTTHAALRTDIPDAFLNFFINAESQLLQYTNSYSGFDFSGMWYSEYTLTYAREMFHSKDFLSSLKIGGAIKYVSGTGYIGLDKNNRFAYKAISNGTSIDVNYKVQSAYTNDFDPKNIPTSFSFKFITNNQAGSGVGMDIGASADFFPNSDGIPGLSLGTSISDIGSITWSSNATERVANNLHRDIKSSGTISELNDSLKALSGILTHISSFTTSLPTMFRFGAMLNLDQAGMSLPFFASKAAIEYDAGLADVVGSLSHPRLGFGISGEHYNSVASLRAEIGYYVQHGQSDLTIGVGTTLFNHISVDVATAHLGDLFASEARTDLALALRVQF